MSCLSYSQQHVKPKYPVTYAVPAASDIKEALDRVKNYLDTTTPYQLIDKSGNPVTDLQNINKDVSLKKSTYRINFYQWGVTYSGMLSGGAITGDTSYTNYTMNRMRFIADAIPAFSALYAKEKNNDNPFVRQIDPKSLDDAGSMCAAMIKTLRAGGPPNLRPLIDKYIKHVSRKDSVSIMQFRFADGTLARNEPNKNTIYLDDMYMSIPALAQAGKLTGDNKYYDDAVKQVLQFSKRLFNKEKGIYMHGWVQEMNPHPEFHWGRANGWAIMAMVELLDVLPANHAGRKPVLNQLQAFIKGLANYQSGSGLWHQLIDKQDSYLETSGSAMFTFGIAKAINKGWINALTYGPMCILAWNGVQSKINALGQVEDGCQGTLVAFDPAYYYNRPVDVYAEHAYGPVLLAGAEVIAMLKKYKFIEDRGVIVLGQD